MTVSLLDNRYRILKPLSEGGFGRTFLAEDTKVPSRKRCVIKQLKPTIDRPGISAMLQQRFKREAAVLESVGKDHSQIPDLYAYFSENGQFYLVQEWIKGKPLSAMVEETWSEERVNRLLTDILGTLAHVHSQNIIHRDIKPDNIILRKGDQLPCLIDFEAVKELMNTATGHSRLQPPSIVIGTPGFMPMEQASGRPVFASDIYSLAMTAIYLLTGRHPTELPTDHNELILWQQFVPKISSQFANVLTCAIQPLWRSRYVTATEMLAALKSTTAISIPAVQVQPVKTRQITSGAWKQPEKTRQVRFSPQPAILRATPRPAPNPLKVNKSRRGGIFEWLILSWRLGVCLLILGLLPGLFGSVLQQSSKDTQSEGKSYIGSMNRAQQAFFQENGEFSSDLTLLGLGIASETENYSYGTQSFGVDYDTYAISTATPEKHGIKGYVGGTFLTTVKNNEITTLAILCESMEPSTDALSPPELVEGYPQCGSGTIDLADSAIK